MSRSDGETTRFGRGHYVSLVVLSAFCLGLWAQSAQSIPAFARKYETSCQTCHVAYPKLNAYERELLSAPTWQFRELEEALR